MRENPSFLESLDPYDIAWGLGSLALVGLGIYLLVESQGQAPPDTLTTAGDAATLATLATMVAL